MNLLSDVDLSDLRILNNSIFDESSIWIYVIAISIIVVFLAFSAFFSASETALSTANTVRLRRYVEERKRGAQKALLLIENYDRTITSILIGNNLCNIGASTASAFIFAKLLMNPSLASIISTLVMTIVVIIFAEITPKTHAKANATNLAVKLSGLMWFFYKLFTPFSFLFMRATKNIKREVDTDEPLVTGEELETIIDDMEDQGVFDEDHADIIQGAVSLGYKNVFEIMTPRVDTVAVQLDDLASEVLKVFLETQYSRLPVYDKDKDNIAGILQVKDFLRAIIEHKEIDDINIQDLMTEPLYVSRLTKVDDLIKEMQEVKKHFAIVSDEYGGTSGVVTMEDALEELVGEIYDEYDIEEEDPYLEKIKENTYKLSADLELDDLYEELDLGTPPSGYATIGSFIYELSEELPEENSIVEVYSSITKMEDSEFIDVKYLLNFKIVKVENRRIRELELLVEDISDLEESTEDKEDKTD